MELPPSLLVVFAALPSEIQALIHVVGCINDFLLPTTIDDAYYNDLQRVIQVYGGFRPCTFGAMDGAASRGRLDILQRLHESRCEGCSSAAFVGAAANDHLDVLQWLFAVFEDDSRPQQEITAAAKRGHLRVVKFLRSGMLYEEVEPAIETVAGNGDVQMVEALVSGHALVSDKPFVAAAVNGHVQVLQLLMDRPDRHASYHAHEAAALGHFRAVELMIERCRQRSITKAFIAAAGAGQIEVVRMLLDRCDPDEEKRASAIIQAAKNNACSVLRLLSENDSLEGQRKER